MVVRRGGGGAGLWIAPPFWFIGVIRDIKIILRLINSPRLVLQDQMYFCWVLRQIMSRGVMLDPPSLILLFSQSHKITQIDGK